MEKNELYHEVFEYFEGLSETPDDEESLERKDLMDRVIGYTGSLDEAQKYFAEVQANVETARRVKTELVAKMEKINEENRKITKQLENKLGDVRGVILDSSIEYVNLCARLGFKPTQTVDRLMDELGKLAKRQGDK